jgi:hypothetical protein
LAVFLGDLKVFGFPLKDTEKAFYLGFGQLDYIESGLLLR